MISAKDLRKGMIVKYEGKLCVVVGTEHIAPGNWRAINQIKFRDIETGSTSEVRFSTSDKLEPAHIDQKEMEYLYSDGDALVCMDQENYEQINISKEYLGDEIKFLKENTIVKVNLYEGKPITVEMPVTIDLKVVETEPGLKGATVTNVFKPAKLETGAIVDVPPFITAGEVIKVDTRTGQYLERKSMK